MKKIIALLIALTSTAHGYLTPQYLNANQLQGVNISATAPTLNQVLLYDGTNWAPTTIATGGGTVTSVAMSVPSFLSVAGSPITSSGTLAVSLSGTALPVANGGTGTTTAFTSGSVLFADGGGVYSQDNANYFWDATNHRLGLGNAAPSTTLDVTGSQNITSNSANALTIGLNGAINPVLQIDTSTASQAAGLKVTGGASGGGVTVSVISSGTNENMTLNTKGTGQFLSQIGGSTRYQSTGTQHLFTVANTTAATARFGFTGAADTSLSATAEAPSVVYALNQIRQHATGAIALQRDYRIAPSTHSFVGASTLTNAVGLAVDGAPIAGTNATITNSSTIYSAGSAVGAGVTNSYGLNINANTGATNNYSAIFNGGNVGIGTSVPSDKLQVASGEIMVSSNTSTSSAVHNGIKFTTDNETYYSAVRANRDTLSTRIGLSFLTANAGVPVETMRIDYAGRVGIGTSAPGAVLDVTGTHNVTSASATSFTVGPTGATNSILQVDSSTASVANGLKITGTAAGSGVKLESISTAANEDIILGAKGGGGQAKVQIGGSNRFTINNSSIIGAVGTNGTANISRYGFTGAADTNLTASTEALSIYFNIGQTRQHATGAIALQRDMRLIPTVHSFVGASTITDAAAFAIDGPSNGGTNATITNSSALYIPTSAMTNVTNAYGLNIAATTGATNNYAAMFNGNLVLTSSAPSVSTCGGGAIASNSSNHKGSITGVSAATACTLTFSSALGANPVCTIIGSAAIGSPLITSISTSAVTFGFSSYTGTLYYHCL